MKEKHEGFRGHVDECLKHFAACLEQREPRASRGRKPLREYIASCCGVIPESLDSWLLQKSSPVGESLIKVMFFLEVAGYRIIELSRMPKDQHNFAELIGYGLLSGEDAARLLGYSKASTVYKIFRGKFQLGKDRNRRLWTAWKERKRELEEKKLHVHTEYRSLWPHTPEASASLSPQKITFSLRAMVHTMEALLALLEDNTLEGSFPPEYLAELEKSADTVLRLSARLSTVSSAILTHRAKGG